MGEASGGEELGLFQLSAWHFWPPEVISGGGGSDSQLHPLALRDKIMDHEAWSGYCCCPLVGGGPHDWPLRRAGWLPLEAEGTAESRGLHNHSESQRRRLLGVPD